jgi:uncharacterized protein YecT (DUF1311 family)
MKKTLAITAAGLLVATAVAVMAAQATDDGRFSYAFEVTPLEGPLDPQVESRYSPAFDTCQEGAATTSANEACFDREFERQDEELNSVWKETLQRLPASLHSQLLASQRQWIAERDPFCKSEAEEFSGGTIAPIIYVSCRVEQTIRRTLWLEQLKN